MKKVLITTDFSPHSKHAIKQVLEKFQSSGEPCQILLLNTYMVLSSDPDRMINLVNLNDELKRESKNGLALEVNEVKKMLKSEDKISINTMSHMGSLKNVIGLLLKKENIDLVVMGKDGGKNVETITPFLKEKSIPLLVTYLDKKS